MLANPQKTTPLNVTQTQFTETNKGTQMNKSSQKTDHPRSPLLRLLPTIFLTTTLLISTTSCSSQRHKKSSLTNLLNAEETLLHSIEAERSTKSIKHKLERDQTLLEAEWHLREAIRAMFQANDAVRKAL